MSSREVYQKNRWRKIRGKRKEAGGSNKTRWERREEGFVRAGGSFFKGNALSAELEGDRLGALRADEFHEEFADNVLANTALGLQHGVKCTVPLLEECSVNHQKAIPPLVACLFHELSTGYRISPLFHHPIMKLVCDYLGQPGAIANLLSMPFRPCELPVLGPRHVAHREHAYHGSIGRWLESGNGNRIEWELALPTFFDDTVISNEDEVTCFLFLIRHDSDGSRGCGRCVAGRTPFLPMQRGVGRGAPFPSMLQGAVFFPA